MKLAKVIDNWFAGKRGTSFKHSLISDGNELRSYDTLIGMTLVKSKAKILVLYEDEHDTFVSGTTSRHVEYVRRRASARGKTLLQMEPTPEQLKRAREAVASWTRFGGEQNAFTPLWGAGETTKRLTRKQGVWVPKE